MPKNDEKKKGQTVSAMTTPGMVMVGGVLKTREQIDAELAGLELENKLLTTEDLRYKVQNERRRREQISHMHDVHQRSIDASNSEIINTQRTCNHRKGGKGMSALKQGRGGDANYSIIHNTYPWGEMAIMCSRCMKEVRLPKPELRRQNAKLYAERMAEWKEWSSWPTDNEPSGTILFQIERVQLSA